MIMAMKADGGDGALQLEGMNPDDEFDYKKAMARFLELINLKGRGTSPDEEAERRAIQAWMRKSKNPH